MTIGDWQAENTENWKEFSNRSHSLGSSGKTCPCCEKKGKCRPASGDMWYCWDVRDDSDVPDGWHFIRELDGGMGSLVAPKWDEQERQKRGRVAVRVEDPKNPVQNSDRDKSYKAILGRAYLEPRDRMELDRRGLTKEEIDLADSQNWLKTWQPFTKIATCQEVAGCYESETRGYRGMFISAIEPTGEIVGGQIMPHDRPEGMPKYYWASNNKVGGLGCQLPNNELPIFHRRHPSATAISRIYLIEGALKSLITAFHIWREDRNAIVIGAALSGRFPASVYEFISSCGDIEVTLLPDKDAKTNGNILAGLEDTFNRCKQVALVKIANTEGEDADDWLTKGNKISDIFLLSNLYDYLGIERLVDRKEEESLTLPQLREKTLEDSYKEIKTYTADITLNQEYLISDKTGEIPLQNMKIDEGSIIFVKSRTGGGKTHLMRHWMNSVYKEKGLLVIGYRNSLLHQFCDEQKGISGMLHLHSDKDEAFLRRSDKDSRIAFCDASLLEHFEEDKSEGKFIIIDEFMSVLESLFTSSTCKKRRGERIERFLGLLRNAEAVICLDAHATNWAVEFLSRSLCKNVTKIENVWQSPDKMNVVSYQGTVKNERDKTWIKAKILQDALDGKRIAIMGDSRIELEALESLLRKKGLHDKEMLRIDSTTSGEAYIQEALKNMDEYLVSHPEIRVVLLSPTGNSGVDISIKNWFDRVYILLCGVLPVNGAMQLFGRVRDTAPQRIVFVASTAVDAGKYSSKSNPECLNQEREARLMSELRLMLRQLSESESGEKRLVERVMLNSIETWWKNEVEDTTSEVMGILASLQGFEKSNRYRKLIEEAILEKGDIEFVTALEKVQEGDTKVEIKEIKQQNCQKILLAEEITSEQAVTIRKKGFPEESERNSLKQFDIKKRIPGVELTEGLLLDIVYDDRDRLTKLEQRYYLKNPQVANNLSAISWARACQEPRFFTGDLRSRIVGRTYILNRLRVELFMEDVDREYNSQHPQIRAMARAWKEVCKELGKKEVEAIMGFTWTPSDSLLSAYRVLGLVGLNFLKVKRKSLTCATRKVQRKCLTCEVDKAILESFEERFKGLDIETASKLAELIAA